MLTRETQLIAAGAAFNVGRFPEPGDRVPKLRVRQARARVLDNSFFWRNKQRPEVNTIISGDIDDIRGLAKRGLVEELAP